jgi:hypothetical protein
MSDVATCLFVTASPSAGAEDVKVVKDCLKLFGVTFHELVWRSQAAFVRQMAGGQKFDFIYLGARADADGFGEQDGAALHCWECLGDAIRRTDCLRPGGTLFLGCCGGGMKTVALKILHSCDKIESICGPLWELPERDLTAAFRAFLQSRVNTHEESCTAAERATEASGSRFCCYEREELAVELEALEKAQATGWASAEAVPWDHPPRQCPGPIPPAHPPAASLPASPRTPAPTASPQ